jgi:protein TonB
VLRAAPQGEGFGEAALALTPLFRMKPMSRDGQPVAGGIVRVPIAFRSAGPAPTPPK